MSRHVLPEPLPLLYPLREVASARSSIQEFAHRRLRITIDHAPLDGVTPEMLLWWFRHIGGDMQYAGATHPRYSVWHPLDHVRWQLAREAPGGGVGEGARFRIVEVMGRDRRFGIDTIDRVEKLDTTGIRLVLRIAGAQFFQLEHTWSAGRGRTHYVSVMDIGSRSGFGLPINAYLRSRVFVPGMAEAWLRHNVEEVGRLQDFLPELYARHGAASVNAAPHGEGSVRTHRFEHGERDVDDAVGDRKSSLSP